MNETLYVHDLALALRTTESAIRSMMRRSPEALPPHCRRGNRIYWRRSTVERWEAEQEAATVAAMPKKTGRPRAVPRVGV